MPIPHARYVPLVIIACFFAAGAGRQTVTNPEPARQAAEEPSVIAMMEQSGVEFRILQIQVRRSSEPVRLPESMTRMGIDEKAFARTIALSMSLRGQGRSSGPASITLSDGTLLRPRLHTNSQLMGSMASATIPQDTEYTELWFEVPSETEFRDIFPIQVRYETTNRSEAAVSFQFDDVTP